MFKYFGKKYKQNKVYMFWQKTNHPIELFSNEVINQKIEYIENNPVAAHIVDTPENYIYSSANKFSKLAVLTA